MSNRPTPTTHFEQNEITMEAQDLAFNTIFKEIPVAFYWMDRDGFLLGANDIEIKMLGLSSLGEIVGKHSTEIASQAVWENSKKVMQKNAIEVLEEEHTQGTGEKVVYISIKKPLHNKLGQVIGLIGVAVDITKQKQIEKKLSSSVQSFTALQRAQDIAFDSFFEYLPINFYWLDKEGVIVWCNKNQLKEFGIDGNLDSIKGKHVSEVANKDAWVTSKKIMENKKAKVIEETHVKNNGEKIIYLSAKSPILDEQQNILGLLGISINITDRKKLEILQKEKEIAEKTARYMEGIAGSLAHELRTPLAIIQSHIDLLSCIMSSDKTDDKEKKGFLKKTVDVIKKTVAAANNLITNILLKLRNLARGEIDKKDFRRNSIVSDISDLLETYPFENDEKDLVEFRPESNDNFEYFGSETLTRHVFYNLLKNALRAIKEADKGKITIKLKKSANGDFNNVVFTDTAIGISPEFLPKIFTQFETKEKSGKGSGLGLPFCKLVMQSYGGDITCDSKEGKYTEFILSFPKAFADDLAKKDSKEYFFQ